MRRLTSVARRLAAGVAFAALTSGLQSCQKPAPSAAERSAGARPVSDSEPVFRRSEVTGIIAEARRIDSTTGISELAAVDIGGIKQWISVRGRDRRNPILLFVHGGPGSPMMPASWFWQTPWEEYFTVVQWDQRGAGKTAASNDAAKVGPTISVERMTADGEAVVKYLRATYHQDKIFLMGHSWGTIIGVNVAQRHPEWLHAYIGMGQAVYGRDNERLGYEFALREARAHGNREAIADLEKIAPYPNPDGTVPVDKILLQRKWVIAYGGLTWHRSTYDYEINTGRLSPDYTTVDLAVMARDDLTSLKQLFGPPNVLDYRPTTVFRCPIFLFAGRYDYETVSSVAHDWYERLQAPKKGFVWFENSAHMLPFEEPGKLFLHLVRDVRPLAGSAN
jgi:pimeloyl-ACP methyl ester carboxylesterase